MAKTPKDHGKDWTDEGLEKLLELRDEDTPTRLIAHKLERTTSAIQNKAGEEDISLKPTNQRPYGTWRK